MLPKRIIIAHSWRDDGIHVQTKALAKKLSETSEVIFLTQTRLKKRDLDAGKIQILNWPHKRPTKLKDYLFAIKLVKDVKPDLVIAHLGATKALLFAGWWCNVKHRLAWYHTLYAQIQLGPEKKFAKLLDVLLRTLVYKLATGVIVFTNYALEDAVKLQHIDPLKITIIPNGIFVPVSKKKSYNYTERQKVFLYVGRISYDKGIDMLISVFSKLKQSTLADIRLEVCGDGHLSSKIALLIQQYQLENSINISGNRPYHEVISLMSNAYALLVPSRTDNYPTVIIEAFACGIPVIGSKAGGIPNMIESQVDGFLCAEENEWVERCKSLIEQPEQRNTMALNARLSYENKFTIEKHISNVMNYIENLS